jgi:hypothetical protein
MGVAEDDHETLETLITFILAKNKVSGLTKELTKAQSDKLTFSVEKSVFFA